MRLSVCLTFTRKALNEFLHFVNGCRKYVDIMTGVKFLSNWLADMEKVYWSVRSYSRKGGVLVQGVEKGGRGNLV